MEKRKYKTRDKSHKICKECKTPFLGERNSKYCCVLCLSRNEYNSNMFKSEWRLNKLCAMAKNRSKVKNLPFDLTKDYLISIWTGKCELTGVEFDLSPYLKKGQVNPNAPSIDRITPHLGYVKGNIRLVSYHVNVALSEFGLENLIKLSKDILNFNKDNNE